MRHAWFLVFGGPEAERVLRAMRRNLARIIVIRAAHRFPKRKRKVVGRAFVGMKLWRALRARGRGAWLSALFAVLQDIDAWTDHVAKRGARRLTRLHAITPVRPPARGLVTHAPAPAPLCADTS
jgi:hypothetical protein